MNQTELSPRVLGRLLFVYSKGDQVRILSAGEEKGMDMTGWRHTVTMDPAKWIIALIKDLQEDNWQMLDELYNGPTEDME
jgi:hypothetical protein